MQQTSLLAYAEVGVPLRLARRYDQILRALGGQELSNTEIGLRCGLPINCVTPRVLELREKGDVVLAGKRRCRVSGRQVLTWRRIENG